MKNGTLVELSGLGHMPPFENYEKFSEVFTQSKNGFGSCTSSLRPCLLFLYEIF